MSLRFEEFSLAPTAREVERVRDAVRTELLPWDYPATRTILKSSGEQLVGVEPDRQAGQPWALVAFCDGRPLALLPVSRSRSRLVPGTTLLRVDELCTGLMNDTGPFRPAALLQHMLATLPYACPRVLRANVALLEPSAEAHSALETLLVRCGYMRAAPRGYTATLLRSLESSEDVLMAGCSSSTRRNIRQATANNVQVRTLRDPSWVPAIQRLVRAAFSRHGAAAVASDVASNAAIAARLSDANSVAIGAFWGPGSDTLPDGDSAGVLDDSRSDALVGVSVFRRAGPLAIYDLSGSLRSPALGRLPVSYLLLWEGMRWAKRAGCTLFDFGGIPDAQSGADDARGSIASFKAGFGGSVSHVGGEWVYRPSPALAWMERVARRLTK